MHFELYFFVGERAGRHDYRICGGGNLDNLVDEGCGWLKGVLVKPDAKTLCQACCHRATAHSCREVHDEFVESIRGCRTCAGSECGF